MGLLESQVPLRLSNHSAQVRNERGWLPKRRPRKFQFRVCFAHRSRKVHDLLGFVILPLLEIGISHIIESMEFLRFCRVAMALLCIGSRGVR